MTTVVAVSGCGGSSDDDAGADSAAEAQARATVDRFYDALKGGDATRVCATLAPDGREEIVESLGEGKPGDTCADAFEGFMRNAQRTGNLSPKLMVKIQSVKVTGDEAMAKVAVGESPVTELPLVYSDGQWQVASAGAVG